MFAVVHIIVIVVCVILILLKLDKLLFCLNIQIIVYSGKRDRPFVVVTAAAVLHIDNFSAYIRPFANICIFQIKDYLIFSFILFLFIALNETLFKCLSKLIIEFLFFICLFLLASPETFGSIDINVFFFG